MIVHTTIRPYSFKKKLRIYAKTFRILFIGVEQLLLEEDAINLLFHIQRRHLSMPAALQLDIIFNKLNLNHAARALALI